MLRKILTPALLAALALQGGAMAVGQDLVAIFAGAEERFVQPSEDWFAKTQQALREEVERVAEALDKHGGEDARYWRKHLRWHLLEKNLGPRETVNLSELELVRRWMYSNRPGLEGPFFAKVRELMDAHLDAAYTFAQEDIYLQFKEKVALAREQCARFEENPTEAHGAALGRTLGWLERTRQLADEVAAVREQASFPNAQVLITEPLIASVLDVLADDVQQSIRIVGQTQTPPSGLLQRSRTLHLSGTANTWGSVALEMVPNDELAELSLLYQGEVEAICHADAGPVALRIETRGPVVSSTPVYVSWDGLRSGETSVTPHVQTRMTDVTGRSAFLRRIAERRANEPASKAQMSSHSRAQTVSVLEEQMQERLGAALAEIKAEMHKTKNSMEGFSEVFAPVQREGVAICPWGTRSTLAGVELNVLGGRREQWGAPTPCPIATTGEGVVARVHVSFFNNAAETIMAGKRFTDRYFMNYAKILQAELPLPLMVHSRSQRWAMIAAKERPLVLKIPSPNRFHFILRMQAFEFDGEIIQTPGAARVAYNLTQNEFGEYRLQRDGELELRTDLETPQRVFLHEKLNAFFAPILDGGGVIVPDGGTLGKIAELQTPEVVVDRDWIVLQISGVKELFLNR